jgi:hypothetical protein
MLDDYFIHRAASMMQTLKSVRYGQDTGLQSSFDIWKKASWKPFSLGMAKTMHLMHRPMLTMIPKAMRKTTTI